MSKIFAINMANFNDGRNLPASRLYIVVLETPTSFANFCWLNPFSFLSFAMLFFTSLPSCNLSKKYAVN